MHINLFVLNKVRGTYKLTQKCLRQDYKRDNSLNMFKWCHTARSVTRVTAVSSLALSWRAT